MTSNKISYVKKLFGPAKIIKGGTEISIRCPNCKDAKSEKFKLDIRLSDDCFSCWVCGIKGRSLYPLIKKFKPQYLSEYAQFKSIKITDQPIEEIEEISLPYGFKILAPLRNSIDPDIKKTYNYTVFRGLTESSLWRYRIGTCTTGQFRRRMVIPSFDAEGNLNYFVGRTIDKDKIPKYMNAKVPKKCVIFNEIDIDWQKPLVLVEGPLDLVKCSMNATCLLGSHIDETYKLFQKIILNNTPIVLALDFDAMKKTQKIAQLFYQWDINVKIINIPSHIDVGDMKPDEFVKYYDTAVQWKPDDRLLNLIRSISSGSII